MSQNPSFLIIYLTQSTGPLNSIELTYNLDLITSKGYAKIV